MNISNLDQLSGKLIKSLSGGYENNEEVEAIISAVSLGKIMLSKTEDSCIRYEDLAGDIFNSKVNNDIPAAQLKKEEKAFKARISRSGTWVMSASYWTGREWECLTGIDDNMIGGFIGYDFFGSGYELQIMGSALEAYNKQILDSNGFVVDPYILGATNAGKTVN